MTNDDRLVELRRSVIFLRGPEFRTSVQARRDYPFGYRAAAQLHHVYTRTLFLSLTCSAVPVSRQVSTIRLTAQIDSIITQAINELERG